MGADVRPLAFLPDAAQVWLLKAALWRGGDALDAWQTWRASRRIETADTGSQRLAPLLYYNLRRNGWDGPEVPLLKGTFRKAWAHNERLAQMVVPLFRAWADLGVGAALLKGAALARDYYPHRGARPMDDLDVLVRIEQVNMAMAAFHEGAWASATGRPVPRRFDADHLRRKRTQRLVNRNGLEMELHWYLLDEGRFPGVDDALWRHVRPFKMRDADAFIPGPEHLLIHVLVHGAQWNAVPPIRWVADAWMILCTAGPAFDWDLVLRETAARRIVLPIRECLGFLAAEMRADIPGRVLQCLHAEKASSSERIEFRLLGVPKEKRPPMQVLWLRHLRMRNLTASRCWIARLATLPESLRIFWRLKSLWHVPLAASAFLFGRSAGARALLALRKRKRFRASSAP